MKRARPGQPSELFLRLVRDEAERMVRFKRLVEFFNRSLGVGWKRILHKRGVMSEDSTARWMFNQQLPRWVSINKLEDHAASMGFVPGARKGRQARSAARLTVPVAAAETARDRALRALASDSRALENRDIAPVAGASSLNFQAIPPTQVSTSPSAPSLNKVDSQQLDFLSALSPNDIQK